jgi:hypothetical protein
MNAPLDADDALVQEALGSASMPPLMAKWTDLSAPAPGLSEAPSPTPQSLPAEPPSPPQPEVIPEFDPRYRDPFEGLLYVGHLHDTATFLGHTFRLVTPSSTERLQIGLVIKAYDGTVGWDFAYASALVAAYLVEVDGQLLPQPITNDPKDTALEQRWEWVLRVLKKPVIDYLFQQCILLDSQVRAVLDAMGKA